MLPSKARKVYVLSKSNATFAFLVLGGRVSTPHQLCFRTQVEVADFSHAVATAERIVVAVAETEVAVISQSQHCEVALRVALAVHPDLVIHHTCSGRRHVQTSMPNLATLGTHHRTSQSAKKQQEQLYPPHRCEHECDFLRRCEISAYFYESIPSTEMMMMMMIWVLGRRNKAVIWRPSRRRRYLLAGDAGHKLLQSTTVSVSATVSHG